ncbi:aa3-type cytochrome c oxidase subunit IV [Jannaschia seohaensis]|uniref:Aa3 type cytochrome c oxidase subunit IV n=1 Tax=Jannaschia seohaensis TaxID=475081 RepID=A0A2Y9AW36_9RHOB|nr:aa3-type cytochrome c oxidase subunit IV [Jannaschia seohaensis]PWJ18222.1 aa3 type cytochrome c oxidase subunit IV [Jannaschia seohaensis]SSA46747.1 aa3 type cytochrome c oxidase subunit IV [Jannaschia seohaensis]
MADEHKHGSMDITQQEKTFAGFVQVTKWTVIVIIAVLVFLAIFRT